MSTEKSDAIVIRQADFSESSRVITLFTKDFGKISGLAKGAKRLKSAFEVSLDILCECRVVFIRKATGNLNLLTESQLIRRFQPKPGSLPHLYGGYYVAELIDALTEEEDPHESLYTIAVDTLSRLASSNSIFVPICHFEISLLREIGQIPDFETCIICHREIEDGESSRFWVAQSGLICSSCGSSEYQTAEFHPESLTVLRSLASEQVPELDLSALQGRTIKEVRRLLAAAISHVLGKRPKTLPLLNF
ncbi:DNA repair protein RecO [Planctomicrobium sp. SH668]|uniref:DNA repair protein RecO n=1 Tax=Planctomicrobium sp. SH668 TaxID=3448126 RepID=UPI003F5B80F8